MDTAKLMAAFHKFNVEVIEYAGWSRRSHGVLDGRVTMVHDSVTGHMSANRAANFCITGHPTLKGPLYECLIDMDGKAHLIANGITWNAGKGDDDRLQQALRALMPLDRELGLPDENNVNGNSISHGVAMVTYGAGPYTANQIEVCARVCAAYGFAEGWGKFTAGSTIGHGEFSRRKIDPFANMGQIRTRINSLILGNNEIWHVVVSGDTLWSLARRYGTTVTAIRQWNSLQADVIGIGWRLRVK